MKRALVTGSGKGIGAAIARKLAADGMHVTVCARSLDSAGPVAEEIGGEALAFDVGDVDAAMEAVGRIEPVDVLVNNAGIDQMVFFTKTDPADWRKLIDVNLMGVLAVTHVLLPHMQEKGWGRVVNVSSEAGRLGSYRGSVYAAAKGGVISFTNSLARENAKKGITCNNVVPGPVETPMLDAHREKGELGEKIIAAMAGATLMGRLGQPEEVAAAVAFLCSEEASFITGETLGVSGGMGTGA